MHPVYGTCRLKEVNDRGVDSGGGLPPPEIFSGGKIQ